MSTFQNAALVNNDDVEGRFRTSLRSTSATRRKIPHGLSSFVKFPQSVSTYVAGVVEDATIDSPESVASFRSSSSSSTKTRAPPRRPRSAIPRSRSRTSQRGNVNSYVDNNSNNNNQNYDASIRNDAPMVERFNHRGEMYPPQSHAWQAFRERLYDSAFSEKYETLQVAEAPRRFRSVSPVNFNREDDDDDESQQPQSDLLFLHDPLSRSVYKNLESFFDRKSFVRAGLGEGELNAFSARFANNNNHHGLDTHRPHSSMELRPPHSSRNSGRRNNNNNNNNNNLDLPPRSNSAMDNNSTFFSRRKKEVVTAPRAQSEERPDEIRRQIQARFARINFDEGTTDYDALFTVGEENGPLLESLSGRTGNINGEKKDELDNKKDDTPKAKLEHLRF